MASGARDVAAATPSVVLLSNCSSRLPVRGIHHPQGLEGMDHRNSLIGTYSVLEEKEIIYGYVS
jgi:hypothetical protein